MENMKSLIKQMEQISAKADKLGEKRKAQKEEVRLVEKAVMGNIAKASSVENRALTFFGVNHPAKLLAINVNAPKYANVPEDVKASVLQLKSSVDVSRWVAQIFHGGEKDAKLGSADPRADVRGRVKGLLNSYYAKNELVPRLKAFGSTVAGEGDEWVPTMISESFVEEYQLEKVLESRFSALNMPSNPYVMPIQSGVGKARVIGENSSISASSFTTAKVQFDAVKFGEYHVLPEELTEDSAPDILAAARLNVVEASIRAVESAIINGDDDGTHIDSDTQAAAADVAEKAWKGIRRQAIANSANGGTVDFGNAAVTEANLRTLRAKLKKFGVNPKDLLIVCGPAVYQQMLSLSSVATLEKFGPMATILQGALSAYQGIPIVISEHMRETLNATGVYDGTIVNRAGIILLNTKRWWVATRRPIIIKAMPDLAMQDRYLLAAYQRKSFKGADQSASEVSCVYGYNIAV